MKAQVGILVAYCLVSDVSYSQVRQIKMYN